MAVSLNLGLFILRLVIGLTLAAHGVQKLFGWFEGSGFEKLVQGYQKQGYRPPWLWGIFVVLGEVGGGLSLALGFLTSLGAAGGFGVMVMAILKVHWKNGFWNSKRGIEFPLSVLAACVAIGLAGPGSYSLDNLFRIAHPNTLLFCVLAAAALVVDIIGLQLTRTPAAGPTEAKPSAS